MKIFALALSALLALSTIAVADSPSLGSRSASLGMTSLGKQKGGGFTFQASGTTVVNVAGTGYVLGSVTFSGTWAATISIDVSPDNIVWVTGKKLYPEGGGAAVTSVTGNGTWKFGLAGYCYFRYNVTYTSGSIAAAHVLSAVDPTDITNATVSGAVTANQGGTWDIRNVTGTVTLPTGAATAAAQASQVTLLAGGLPAALGAGGGLKIDGSGTALPVSQSGVFTVQPGNTANTTAWKVDGSAVTQPISVAALPLPTGAATSAQIGEVQASPTANTVLDRLKTLNTTLGSPLQAGGNVNLIPTTSGGYSVFRSLDFQNGTSVTIDGSAGQIYGWYIFNSNITSYRYVKFYNKTSATSADTPIMTIPIPPGSASNITWAHGIPFGTAISVRATTAVADNDNGAPTANDVIGIVLYK